MRPPSTTRGQHGRKQWTSGTSEGISRWLFVGQTVASTGFTFSPLFARQLGYDWELCAAEPRLPRTPATVFRLAAEAYFVCWSDLGTRWARFIGNRRMLARVT